MRTVVVRASRTYDVLIEAGILDRSGKLLRQVSRSDTAVIVSGEKVYPLYGQRLKDSLEKAGFRVVSFLHPSGEEHKTLETYAELLSFMAREHVTRSDLMIALGGGVTGDLCGFAAATYLRGIDFAQIPTTLLAMVDSSVGGKTAVDLPEGKNLVGAFYQPIRVLCDPETLETLPEEQFICGCAEVIKYGVLGNEAFFDSLVERPVRSQLETVIQTCVEMKRDIVLEDEFDRGRRQLLNLGHSIGHAVEACSSFSILHGQAVAIGMAMITRASYAKGICEEDTLRRLLSVLQQYGLPCRTDLPASTLLQSMAGDKKRSGDRMNLIVPEAIGRCRIERVPISSLQQWLLSGGAK